MGLLVQQKSRLVLPRLFFFRLKVYFIRCKCLCLLVCVCVSVQGLLYFQLSYFSNFFQFASLCDCLHLQASTHNDKNCALNCQTKNQSNLRFFPIQRGLCNSELKERKNEDFHLIRHLQKGKGEVLKNVTFSTRKKLFFKKRTINNKHYTLFSSEIFHNFASTVRYFRG